MAQCPACVAVVIGVADYFRGEMFVTNHVKAVITPGDVFLKLRRAVCDVLQAAAVR